MPASRVKIDERLEIIIKGAVFEGYNLCHLARERGETQPLEDGEFSKALLALGKKPESFIKDIREKYDPLFRGKKTSSGRGSGRSSNDPALADEPYDPTLCCKRVWNGGLGAQCQSAKDDGCEFCTRCTKEFGNKGALPFGYYNEEKPSHDLVTNKSLPWKKPGETITVKQPAMKVAEIRERLEELGLDSSGKKREIAERLNAAINAGEEDETPSPVKVQKEKVKKGVDIKKSRTTPKKVFKKKSKPVQAEVAPIPAEVAPIPAEVAPIPAEVAPQSNRIMENIVFKNGKSLDIDLGPEEEIDNGEGTGLKLIESPVPEEDTQELEEEDEHIEEQADEEQEQADEEQEKADEEQEQADEEQEQADEEQEKADEEQEPLEMDDFIEMEYEDHDYLISEVDDKVYTMDGVHIGCWDEDEGIVWLDSDAARTIKEQNGHE